MNKKAKFIILAVVILIAWWEDIGSASYGFLLEVQANDMGAVPATQPDYIACWR